MNIDKDYYQILGVALTAEFAVIKAAYKALAMLYHPDRNIGNEVEANKKMLEINEAFSILSDESKRMEYDKKRASSNGSFYYNRESEQEPKVDPLNDEWEIAEFHYPDLKRIIKNLESVSWKIAYAYKAYLIESKEFKKRFIIAKQIEVSYLSKYFGESEVVQDFAKRLIKENRYDAAKFLNKAIKALGDEIDGNKLIDQIKEKFSIDEYSNSDIKPECEVKSSRVKSEDEIKRERNRNIGCISIILIFLVYVIVVTNFT